MVAHHGKNRRVALPSFSVARRARTALLAGLLGSIALFSFAATGARAADKTLVDKGEVLVRDNCSRCHAIGKEGDSPHPEAPPFRTLSSRYPIEDLAESLAEGIVSGHPDMPIFVFNPHDVEAVIEYLQSIQAQ
jgi:mono/diheme cytochrome c family protein